MLKHQNLQVQRSKVLLHSPRIRPQNTAAKVNTKRRLFLTLSPIFLRISPALLGPPEVNPHRSVFVSVPMSLRLG